VYERIQAIKRDMLFIDRQGGFDTSALPVHVWFDEATGAMTYLQWGGLGFDSMEDDAEPLDCVSVSAFCEEFFRGFKRGCKSLFVVALAQLSWFLNQRPFADDCLL